MKKRKNLIVGVLILMMVLVSGFTFAYWASGVNGSTVNSDATIQIGTGTTVETKVVVGALDLNEPTGGLVPQTQAGVSDVDITFNVNWVDDGNGVNVGSAGSTGTLVVAEVSVMVGTVDVSDLFIITIPSDVPIVAGTAQDSIVNVLFNIEPRTQAEYNDVQGGILTITISFTVTNPNA